MAELFNEEIISQATHTKWAGKPLGQTCLEGRRSGTW